MDGLNESRAPGSDQDAAEKTVDALSNNSSSPNKPAPLQNQPFIILNGRWRIRLTDPQQWILERRHGAAGKKDTGYKGKSFCATRRVLIRNIKEDCGPINSVALRMVAALPEQFPYRGAA